jgi:DUF4097 and DUF4098 domain-containing protein YvlB
MQNKPNLATWLGTVLGVLLALALNASLAHASDSARVTEEFHHTYPLSANGRVELDNINGAVHISVWDQNQVKVDAVKRAENEQELKDAEIRVVASPNAVSISTHYPQHDESWNRGNHNSASVEYTVTVPRNANLDEVKLINGPLDVTGVLGEVHASCINGKLRANGLANTAKLSTVNGSLDAKFDRLPSGRIELESVNGHVELTLPSDAKASIEAATVHGRISNEFGLRTSNHFVGHDMKGQLGGGGTHIRLSNVNGAIEVHHANDGKAMSPAKDSGNDRGDDEI